jgi:hypothetical protein
MSNKRIISSIAVLSALLLCAYLFFGRIVISIFASSNNLNITYKAINSRPFKGIFLKGFAAVDKKTGRGISADSADIKIRYNLPIINISSIAFGLSDVNFIKNIPDDNSAYDSLEGLAAMPFHSSWQYKKVSGEICPVKDGVRIKGLEALSDDIKISVTGIFYNNRTLESDITIYFSDNVTGKVPAELSGILLRDEKDGWKSLSVTLKGDMEAPAIQVSGKLFRLNIATISSDANK